MSGIRNDQIRDRTLEGGKIAFTTIKRENLVSDSSVTGESVITNLIATNSNVNLNTLSQEPGTGEVSISTLDEKVRIDAFDPTPGFLEDKIDNDSIIIDSLSSKLIVTKVDGKAVDDAEITSDYLWTASQIISYIGGAFENINWQKSVLSRSYIEPPAELSDGDHFIIGSSYYDIAETYTIGSPPVDYVIRIAGDVTSDFSSGDTLRIRNASISSMNSQYTVDSVSYITGSPDYTDIYINETIEESLADGELHYAKGAWSVFGPDEIVEYESASPATWINTTAGTGSPTYGWAVWVVDEDMVYYYNNIEWIDIRGGGGGIHNDLLGLQGGASSQYYHLKLVDYSALTHVDAQLGSLITSGSPTFDSLTITDKLTVGGLIDPVGLVLDPQASSPLGSDKGLWIDSNDDKLVYNNGISEIKFETLQDIYNNSSGDFYTIDATGTSGLVIDADNAYGSPNLWLKNTAHSVSNHTMFVMSTDGDTDADGTVLIFATFNSDEDNASYIISSSGGDLSSALLKPLKIQASEFKWELDTEVSPSNRETALQLTSTGLLTTVTGVDRVVADADAYISLVTAYGDDAIPNKKYVDALPDRILSVNEVVDETVVSTGDTYQISSVLLDNENILIAYRDGSNSNYGTFVIYDSSGTEVVSETVFNAGDTYEISSVLLNNGNILIAYRDGDNSHYGTFVIYDSSGTKVVSETEFNAGDTYDISSVLLDNGNILIAYRDYSNSYYGTFVIYGSSGAEVVDGTVFNTGSTYNISSVLLNNGNILIAYQDGSNSGYGTFVIYNSSGTEVVDETVFNAGYTGQISSVLLDNGNILIAYQDYSNFNYGTFVIYNSSGAKVVSETEFNTGSTHDISPVLLDNGNILIVYRDGSNSHYGTFVIYDSSGAEVVSETEFNAGGTFDISSVLLDNGNILIAYRDGSNSYCGTFVIYGMERLATTLDLNALTLQDVYDNSSGDSHIIDATGTSGLVIDADNVLGSPNLWLKNTTHNVSNHTIFAMTTDGDTDADGTTLVFSTFNSDEDNESYIMSMSGGDPSYALLKPLRFQASEFKWELDTEVSPSNRETALQLTSDGLLTTVTGVDHVVADADAYISLVEAAGNDAIPNKKYVDDALVGSSVSPGSASGQLLFWNSSSWVNTETGELYWDDSSKFLGVNTVTPVAGLTIGASSTFYSLTSSSDAVIGGNLEVQSEGYFSSNVHLLANTSLYLDGTGNSVGISWASVSSKVIYDSNSTTHEFDNDVDILNDLGVTNLITAGSDVEITDSTKGIILSDGTDRWRITVDTNGDLVTTKL